MDTSLLIGLQQDIVNDLKAEIKNDPNFDEDILKSKVKSAIRDVRLRRNYGATSYTNEQIADDLENYYSIIKNIALYDYNQSGAEGQKSHSENDISRSWADRNDLFKGIVAFVKVF